MQLDQNTNRGGRGKYALVNMRRVIPILDKRERNEVFTDGEIEQLIAFELLVRQGVITLCNETPEWHDRVTASIGGAENYGKGL